MADTIVKLNQNTWLQAESTSGDCSAGDPAILKTKAAAGEFHIGEVGGILARPTANFTRPADTTAYASGDLVANSTTAGSVTPLSLTCGRGSSGSAATGLIRRIKIHKTNTGVTNSSFRVHLYSASPTCSNGDNSAWLTTQAAGYLGAFDVTVDRAFSDGAAGVGAPITGSDVAFTTQTVYALIEARGAYTPGNAEVFTVTAEVLQN